MKLLAFVSLIFLAACTTSIQNPSIRLKEARITSLNTEGASLDVLLAVSNPNSFDLTVNGYSYEMKIAQLPFAHGASEESQTFPGLAESSLTIPVRISWADFLEIALRRSGFAEIPYQFAADLNLETPVGSRAVPVKKCGTVTVPEQYRPGNLLRKFGGILENSNR